MLLASLLVVSSHYFGGVEIGSVLSSLIVIFSSAIGAFGFLFFIKKTHDKHVTTVVSILNSVGDLIVIKDQDDNTIFCNDALQQLSHSIASSETKQRSDGNDITFQQNLPFCDELSEIVRDFKARETYETIINPNTGEQKDFFTTKLPFQDVNGDTKLLVIAKDISEQVALKEEVIKHKTRLNHVLDVSEEGLWEWNVATNDVFHNDQWIRIVGVERSENTFAEFQECIFVEDRDKVNLAIERMLKYGHSYNIEFRMRRPDGKVIWIWDRGRIAEKDENNNPLWIVGIIQDITATKEDQQRAENLAYYDQLTGLINRVQLDKELVATIDMNRERDIYSAVLFLDLDRFKLLNDNYGHRMGDKLLQAVSDKLRQLSLKKKLGTVSRFGGDEFVIVLPLLNEDQAIATQSTQAYADAVVQTISEVMTLDCDEQGLEIKYAITASVGGIVFKYEGVTSELVLQLADTALHRTKSNGGHGAMIFNAEMQDELNQVSQLQKSIHHAIINREFIIHLQPKYNQDEKIIGAEALVRWEHPERGTLSPFHFIDMAEDSNMILPIGKMVIEQVCQQLKRWQAFPETAHLQISVNLSAKQIWQSGFVDDFINTVAAFNIDHTKLIVEVTESVLILDIDDASEKLMRLKEYGVSISLDDFGTGYSSLNYLRALPIDELKIDRSFIMDVTNDKQALLMVKSIVDLANNFGMRVVSEGVEDKEQLELIRNLGVSIYQGFYFSKPLPIAEMDELLQLHPKLRQA